MGDQNGNGFQEVQKDDLTKIEGIGPKIQGLLYAAGIYTYEALANADSDTIVHILNEAGPRYQMHDPETWPMQAMMAANNDWEGLKALQEELNGGKVK